jgi:hypothetical protein
LLASVTVFIPTIMAGIRRQGNDRAGRLASFTLNEAVSRPDMFDSVGDFGSAGAASEMRQGRTDEVVSSASGVHQFNEL